MTSVLSILKGEGVYLAKKMFSIDRHVRYYIYWNTGSSVNL